MALAILLKRIRQEGGDWRIDSSGTWAYEGDPVAEKVQQVLVSRELELNEHHSKLVTYESLSSHNLILTMERGHKEALQAEFPQLSQRIFMLSEMIDLHYDIRDPYGGPLYEFEETANEIEHILTNGFEKIKKLASDPAPLVNI